MKQAASKFMAFLENSSYDDISGMPINSISRAATDLTGLYSEFKGWEFNPTGRDQQQRRI